MPVGNRGALFQRRHYEAIAAVVRSLGCVTEFERRNIALEFSLLIGGTNSAFNADRFIAACLPPSPPTPVVQAAPVAPAARTCEMCSDVATWQHVQRSRDTRYFCGRHGGSCRLCTPLATDN